MLVIMAVLLVAMLCGIYMWKSGKKDTVRNFLSRFASFRELFSSMDLYRFTSCFDMFLSSGEHQDDDDGDQQIRQAAEHGGNHRVKAAHGGGIVMWFILNHLIFRLLSFVWYKINSTGWVNERALPLRKWFCKKECG